MSTTVSSCYRHRSSKAEAEPVIENIQTQSQVSEEPSLKRLHTESNIHSASVSPDRIYHWVHELCWPKRDYGPDPTAGPASKRSRSASTVSDAELDDSSATPSDQKTREQKSALYRDARYSILLETKGTFMKDSEAGILAADVKFCKSLLTFKKDPPSDSLLDDRFFRETIYKISRENETRVIRDIGHLISPSAECLATRGMRRLRVLKESTNAGWNNAIPFEGPRPQPDFSVGFDRSAFSNDQIRKMRFDLYAKTYFTATYQIYFPFITSEVKCGLQALDVADRQNAHSMTVAIRGIVELYRIVGRAVELNRKVLAFSISHDYEKGNIYAHYPEIHGPDTKYYRHLLMTFNLLRVDGKERWTAYQFVRNVYGSFVPVHLKRIKSAIDQLPDPALESLQSIQSAEGGESSQEIMTTSAPSSQEAGFLKPAPPTRGVAAELRKELEHQRNQNEELMTLLKQNPPDAGTTGSTLQRQLEEQQEEAERQRQEVRRERERFEQMVQDLQKNLEQQREEAKQEKQELKEEKNKLMEMLMQRLS
ncbi:MAG: hypothetical protein M1825_003465 [Sarcosagium campestre]|nr:MAG: hypothetical protein M1825_003465 [Sarcosagium campestre]